MAQIEKILEMMRREPGNVGFNDFKKVCVSYFGKPRQAGTATPFSRRLGQAIHASTSRTPKARQSLIKSDKCFKRSKN
jgi:hypothetical protein